MRRRAGLIIGNAVLFAALGCDSDTSDGEGGAGGMVAGAGGMTGGSTGGAGGMAGAGGAMGGAGGEAGGAGGMAGAGGAVGGAGGVVGGAGGEAGGAGGEIGGAGGMLADAGVSDAEVPDAEIPDAEIPDAEIPDAEIPDAEVPDAEISNECVLGAPCDFQDQGCCEADGADPTAICWQGATGDLEWQAVPQDFFCSCAQNPDGTYSAFCAVPGFVGLTASGQPRRAPTRLRALMRPSRHGAAIG